MLINVVENILNLKISTDLFAAWKVSVFGDYLKISTDLFIACKESVFVMYFLNHSLIIAHWYGCSVTDL